MSATRRLEPTSLSRRQKVWIANKWRINLLSHAIGPQLSSRFAIRSSDSGISDGEGGRERIILDLEPSRSFRENCLFIVANAQDASNYFRINGILKGILLQDSRIVQALHRSRTESSPEL